MSAAADRIGFLRVLSRIGVIDVADVYREDWYDLVTSASGGVDG